MLIEICFKVMLQVMYTFYAIWWKRADFCSQVLEKMA